MTIKIDQLFITCCFAIVTVMMEYNYQKTIDIMKEQFQEMQIQLDQMTDEEIFDKELKEEGKI